MKLEVVSTLRDGLNLLKENPKIFVPLTASVVLWLLVAVFFHSIGLEHDTLLKALISLLLIWVAAETLGYIPDNVAIKVAASGETHLKDALLFTLRKLPALLSIYMLIVVPASLLIVPGIYLRVRLLFFNYAILVDNEKAIDSLKKSWKLVKGNWLRTFALLAVFAAIGFPLGYLLEIGNPFLWTLSCTGMMFVRGWAVASLTLAYLQLASKPEKQQKPKPNFAEQTTAEEKGVIKIKKKNKSKNRNLDELFEKN